VLTCLFFKQFKTTISTLAIAETIKMSRNELIVFLIVSVSLIDVSSSVIKGVDGKSCCKNSCVLMFLFFF
jgi:hypothetical protein